MPLQGRSELGPSFPSNPPDPRARGQRVARLFQAIGRSRATRSIVRPPALAMYAAIAGIIFAGCDARRQQLNTVPTTTSEADVDLSQVPKGPAVPDITSAEAASKDAAFADLASAQDLQVTAALGDPLRGLDDLHLKRFFAGMEEFKEVETAATGLGPVFNENSCVSCHDAPVGGTNGRLEFRFGRWEGGVFDPLERLGGSLLQDDAIGRVDTEHGAFTFVPEVVPREATVRAGRLTVPLFGAGLVDAIPDATLLALARLQAFYSPGTRGTANLVRDLRTGATRVGRFGWKSQIATLGEFAGDAYLNEMGITSPDFPHENLPQGSAEAMAFNPAPGLNDDGGDVEAFTDFITLLGPPPRSGQSYVTAAGEVVFYLIGCASCHTPTLVTGDSPVPALSRKRFHPYSDFLLHDMGSSGDGIVQGNANGRQMRTSALWGMGSRTVFMHDGRAKTPEQAIFAHGGQGAASAGRYARLGPFYQALVQRFLKSL